MPRNERQRTSLSPMEKEVCRDEGDRTEEIEETGG